MLSNLAAVRGDDDPFRLDRNRCGNGERSRDAGEDIPARSLGDDAIAGARRELLETDLPVAAIANRHAQRAFRAVERLDLGARLALAGRHEHGHAETQPHRDLRA